MKRGRPTPATLFMRWVWLVYLPLGLAGVLLLLLASGLLPSSVLPVLLALLAWAGIAGRLLYERRRRGVRVKPPKAVVVWTAGIAGLLIAGALLLWMGTERLSTDIGLAIFATGAFLMVLAVTMPAFKIVDSVLRRAARIFSRARK